jgi:hypothetical protein
MAAPPADLTAILVPEGVHDRASVTRVISAGPYGDGWLRVRPLAGVGLTQIELLDGGGLPRADPALVAALSDKGRAVFVHVNHQAKQALVHAFEGGRELHGWVGEPPAIDGELGKSLPITLADLIAADDGSRRGFGVAASDTVGLSRGRELKMPAGMPTALGSFGFHDRGGAGVDRVAPIAIDVAAVRLAWHSTPGAELAVRLRALPAGCLGPLAQVREQAEDALYQLGDQTPAQAELRSTPALELVALTEAYLFGGGEAVPFVDQRLLPMFSLASGEPALDPEEAEELEQAPSVLEAMVDVLPYGSPEGAVLEQIEDRELSPLATWARPGDEVAGSLFLLGGERVRKLLWSVDATELAARVDRFYRAWWKAGHDGPEGDEFLRWRDEADGRGRADIDRFLAAWGEWRALTELGHVNGLQIALWFYMREEKP